MLCYTESAQVVKLEDITSSARNAEILRRLRDDLPLIEERTEIKLEGLIIADEDYDYTNNFVVKEYDDWGWLGYFIGKSTQIRDLGLYYLPEDEDDMDAFMEGFKRNRSIVCITINWVPFTEHLFPFIIHNSNLKELRLLHTSIGGSFCARSLAMALKKRTQKSLTELWLWNANLSTEALSEILDALSGYNQLESLLVHEELIVRDEEYYDMLAQIIDLNGITSSKENAEILRRLRDNDNVWDEEEILNVGDDYYGEDEDFCAEEGDDWGWLGYFIGRNKQVHWLSLECLPEDEDDMDAFMNGLCRNESIEKLHIYYIDIDLTRLSPFIIHNSSLKDLRFFDIDIGLGNDRSLAMALQQRQNKSLNAFCISGIDGETFREIAVALSDYPSLQELCVSTNSLIGREGCEPLGAIITSAALHLEYVGLSENAFDDEAVQTLVAALTNASSLRLLNLSHNPSITATGLRALSRLFQSACPLETLLLEGVNIGDEGAEILANGLVGNTSLKHLAITPGSAGITSSGWSAFSRLLCDDSSINNTYQSNHTLEHIGGNYYYTSNPDGGPKLFCSRGTFLSIPSNVGRYLTMNKKYFVRDAARIKIGMCHPDMPVEVFFQYNLKFLPLLVSWFGMFGTRKCTCTCGNSETREYQVREVSAVYKFIRGMPMLAVDCKKLRLISSCSCGRKRKFQPRIDSIFRKVERQLKRQRRNEGREPPRWARRRTRQVLIDTIFRPL